MENRTARISFKVEIPDGVSNADARAALLYHLHWDNKIKGSNPMVDHHIDPIDEPMIDFDIP